MNNLLKKNIDTSDKLTDNEFLKLKKKFQFKKYVKGDFIIKEGDKVQDIYFISLGLVKLSYIDSEVKEHILSFAYENWWETDFSAFYNQTKATLNLQCIEDTFVYSLSYDVYTVLCLDSPQLANFFLDKSIQGHIASQKRILSLLTLNPKEKNEQFLHLYPSLTQRLPKAIIASYLGVSRETLSRLY